MASFFAPAPSMDGAPFPDDVVWHYTNGPGLIGILTNHVLWASSASFMNDSNELLTGRHVIAAEFDRIKDTFEVDEVPWVAELVDNLMEQNIRQGSFVLSACRESDNLTMWRLYGDQEVSYAVGLKRSIDLTPRVQREGERHPHAPASYYDDWVDYGDDGKSFLTWDPDDVQIEAGQWANVIYGAEEQGEVARDVLSRFRRAVQARRTGKMNGLGEYFAVYRTDELHLVKDPGFVDERESRIISQVNPHWKLVKHRAGRFGLVPYVELGVPKGGALATWPEPMNPLPIAGIRIGPSPYAEEARQSLLSLMEFNGYDGVRVELSRTPYR